MLSPLELTDTIRKVREAATPKKMYFELIPLINDICDAAENVYCRGWTAEQLGECLKKAKVGVDALEKENKKLNTDINRLQVKLEENEELVILLKGYVPRSILRKLQLL
jgi:hypothetical protein